MIGLEKLEALRFAHYVNRERGRILVNDHELIPASVVGADENYPHETIDYLRDKGFDLIILPATKLAVSLGDGRMANVVMLGALSTLLPIPEESWQKALHVRLPARYLEGNLKAFAAGQREVTPEAVS